MTGRTRFSAVTHLGVDWPKYQLPVWARKAFRYGSPAMRGSEWLFLDAEIWPARSVHSTTLSVIHRICVNTASRFAGSGAFGLGNTYWCGPAHATCRLKRRGTGATAKSSFASRRPVKFHEPASHRPSLPATKASRQFALPGGATLSLVLREPQNSATSTAAGSASADRLRSGA